MGLESTDDKTPRLPADDGIGWWENADGSTGERGNSTFYHPEKAPEGIPFKDNVPDFQQSARDVVEIDEFSGNRAKDKREAMRKMKEKHGANWKQPKDTVWHHFERDGKFEMQLVDKGTHGKLAHTGPHAKVTRRQAVKDYLKNRNRGGGGAGATAIGALTVASIAYNEYSGENDRMAAEMKNDIKIYMDKNQPRSARHAATYRIMTGLQGMGVVDSAAVNVQIDLENNLDN
ncbi:HNH endonuclease [Cerasicoccus arenae]|uniref:Uncharacterized protein n=1 Tax=Cerasicoccus arenae TaxID=424488 RepID=A0A8J3DEB2_9BACT|nr:HNH endonuclease [Cerasicoccus arenae]MBK1860069.1 HNH endonuclease [Cerasicoccus arenae]GHC14095.1 hypothetical protein GCM10007047_34200 [Cerasicoccus arenae]